MVGISFFLFHDNVSKLLSELYHHLWLHNQDLRTNHIFHLLHYKNIQNIRLALHRL